MAAIPNQEKLKELILFIAEQCEGDPSFGSVKLNKILFFADFIAYRKWRRPITGVEYQALPQGPAPRIMLPVLEQMEQAGDLVIAERVYYGYPQKRPMARREPCLSSFSAEEIALVGDIIRQTRFQSAGDISELSHRFIGWQVAHLGETIPYEVAWIDRRPPAAEEAQFGQTLTPLAERLLAS